MQNTSNNIKASLFLDDIRETQVKREQGFTLQRFHYESTRKRDEKGMPYGPPQTTILRLLIKSLPDGYLKELYKRLREHSESCFSIVFNAVLRTDEEENTLTDFDSGLIVTGYTISVDGVEGVKRSVAMLPSTFAALEGADGKSVIVLVKFSNEDDGEIQRNYSKYVS